MGSPRTRPPLAPPTADRDPVASTHHGDTRIDDFAWLRDREDLRVRAYLEAENVYADAMLPAEAREALFREILSHVQETDESAPVRWGDFDYFTRTVERLAYPIHCRRRVGGDAEEVLLDRNALAEGHAFHSIGVFAVSDDHRRLAYSEDVTGDESYTLRVKDLATGEPLPDTIEGTYYTLAWANDSRSFVYTVHDETMRPCAVRRHVLGTDASDDVEVFTETDERFHVGVDKVRSHRFAFVYSESLVSTETHYTEAETLDGAWRPFALRRPGVEFDVEHQGDRFLIRTNEDAVNFRLFETPVDDVSRERWREIVPHRPDVKLEAVDAFRDHVVLYERSEGLRRMRVLGSDEALEEPEAVYALSPGSNPTYDASVLRFSYSSPATPTTHVDHDLVTGDRTIVKRDPVPGYDPSAYVTERIWATADDGTRVPISLVRRRDGALPAPCWLYAYGSYGASIDPVFWKTRVSVLERGFVYAIAHVRGGGELGEPWRDAGKLDRKANTFTDFIACARHLVEIGYTSPERLAIEGVSAGGLLVGAVLNLAPELFGAAIADVPFVDALNTILDPTLPLTAIEWEEWGNPIEDADVYRYMKSYAPYENVGDRPYPPILALAGWSDTRVSYWEPAKWVAKLRTTGRARGPILLKTNLDAGHGGPSGRYESYREEALKQAFVFDRLA